jgi:hypothetical protein
MSQNIDDSGPDDFERQLREIRPRQASREFGDRLVRAARSAAPPRPSLWRALCQKPALVAAGIVVAVAVAATLMHHYTAAPPPQVRIIEIRPAPPSVQEPSLDLPTCRNYERAYGESPQKLLDVLDRDAQRLLPPQPLADGTFDERSSTSPGKSKIKGTCV